MEFSRVKIRDRHEKYNTWTIEEEKDRTFKVSCKGYITEIYKIGCYLIIGRNGLYTDQVRNIDYPDFKDWYDGCIVEDKSIDLGYLEDDYYGMDIVYDDEGNAYGV